MPQRQDVSLEKTASQVLVVADDFTGANDAGVGLALQQAQVNVILDLDALTTGTLHEVTVINTDSRAQTAQDAALRVVHAVTRWREAGGNGWVFKKIDSTLRGNLGAEIAAALTASDAAMALIAPAVPALGRITRDGKVWVNGKLLTETEFASDPKTPVHSADIAERIAEQSALTTATLIVSENNHFALAAQLLRLRDEGIKGVIIDAQTPQDLEQIVAAAQTLPVKPLLVGAAGLSDALAQALCFTPRPRPALLAVVGSMSEMTHKQITAVSALSQVTLLDVDIRPLFTPAGAELAQDTARVAATALLAGRHCLVRTCRDEQQRHEITQLCQQYGLSRQQLGERISDFLGEMARCTVALCRPAGLYLSGGDVAISVAAALGATGFHIKGQLASCVPWGRFIDSIVGDIPVMTKAGGFGDEATLHHVLRFIEERVSE